MYNAVSQQPSPGQTIWDKLTEICGVIWWVLTCFGLFKPKPVIRFKDKQVKILRQIGEGGFSFVYLAQDEQKRQYAVKKILIQTPEQSRAAQWEQKVMESIEHSNILQLIDCQTIPHETNESFSYVVMLFPYYEQGTLLGVIQRMKASGRRLSEMDCLQIFRSVCQALQVLHAHDPVWAHRDIKLDNVLLDKTNKPVLMDFGSVSAARLHIRSRRDAIELQEWAAEHCTSPYRAPELFDCPSQCDIDERTDIWSLGCLLFGIAFGNSPFEPQDDGGNIAMMVASGNIPFPEEPNYSREYCDMVRWMLTTDFTQRPFIDEVLDRTESIIRSQLRDA